MQLQNHIIPYAIFINAKKVLGQSEYYIEYMNTCWGFNVYRKRRHPIIWTENVLQYIDLEERLFTPEETATKMVYSSLLYIYYKNTERFRGYHTLLSQSEKN